MSKWSNHRVEKWEWRLLDFNDKFIRTLDGVADGKIDESIFSTVRGAGDLSMKFPTRGPGALEVPDWNRVRVQPWYTAKFLDGTTESWPQGVFLPAAPNVSYSDEVQSVDVQLFDKLLLLDQDRVDNTFSVGTDAIVTLAVANILRDISNGDARFVGLTPSPETLRTPMFWDAGTSKLQIINELLSAINYLSVFADGYGVFRANPYVAPASRPEAWRFLDGEDAVYLPDFDYDKDTFDVPNKVVCISNSDGEAPALRAVATNTDPSNRFSFQARGNKWFTRVEPGVDATSIAVLQAKADRLLAEGMQTSATINIKTAMVPLQLNDAVLFGRQGLVDPLRAVLQTRSFNTRPGSLVEARIQEVMS